MHAGCARSTGTFCRKCVFRQRSACAALPPRQTTDGRSWKVQLRIWRVCGLSRARNASDTRTLSQAREAPTLVEWDVVVYQSGSDTAVGRISKLQAQVATIDRLEEEGEGLWAVTDQVDVVQLQQVQGVLDADYMQLCDPDRISNPHGEHAYEVFKILQAVPPGVWGSLNQSC